ncbi:YjbF family lipoprotein [Sulfitobacter albidus]|uniref:YjbF family lipoprotein n=1 Tax=Sulfitobacter albidus TaxID=2829501 RepID=A0A975JD57_9RHOB|nr:YjbF family lipoprotein [Sulfitobacter albidus]QUJ76076.1 YjbF family lipoprotein [Sulfitobacter albidus]
MRRMGRGALGALVGLSLLAACSSESANEERSLGTVLVGSLREAVRTQRAERAPKVQVTPKMLAETREAALQINPELLGGSDFLRRAASRRDSHPGRVEIWNSSDNAQVFLRDGVLVGTRGVGGDIIAADATMTVLAVQGRRANAGLRSYEISNGDATTTKFQLQCDVSVVGRENIIVVNQKFPTTHLRENCRAGEDARTVLSNDYWVQDGSGLVRKSRQWVGPRSGYFEMILLKN